MVLLFADFCCDAVSCLAYFVFLAAEEKVWDVQVVAGAFAGPFGTFHWSDLVCDDWKSDEWIGY